MNKLALLSLAALVGLGACGSDSGVAPPTVSRVQIDPSEAALAAVGATAQFTAQAFDADGTVMVGVTFDWSSTNATVATVDASGRATALSVGETFVRAEADNVADQARLVVRECGEALSLAPGDWTAVDVPAQNECGFILNASGPGEVYRVAIVRTGSTGLESDVPTVSLRVNPFGESAAPPAAAPIGRLPLGGQVSALPLLGRKDVSQLLESVRMAERTSRYHRALREREAQTLALVGREGLLPPFPEGGRRVAARVEAPDRIEVDATTPTLCTPAGPLTPAFKVAENDDMAIYQDSAQALVDSLQVTAAQAQRMLDYYTTHGKPIIEDYFGGVSDIDGNGKILLVAHPILPSGVAAQVWSGDFLSRDVCPASNEAELIFFNAGLITAMDDGNFQALETAAHEAKHVSSLYKGIARGTNRFHPAWLEEGSAEIAGNMSARRAWSTVGGPAPNARVTAQDIIDTSSDDNGDLLPEFYGVAIRMLRTQGFLASQPNGVIVTPLGADSGHSIYGSGWVFLRWLGDAYGNGGAAPYADAPFFRQQNDSLSLEGVPGLQALTGQTFSQLMIEFAAAVMANGTVAPQPARQFTAYDFVSAVEIWCFAADNPPCDGSPPGPAGTFPWPVTTRVDGQMWRPFEAATFQGKIGPAGIRIHDFQATGPGQSAEIVVTAGLGTRAVVLRIR